MRWTEIEAEYARRADVVMPTYRQMDVWTRQGLLVAETRGDHHGRYRWWPLTEVRAALLVAALMSHGMTAELAFKVARTQVDTEDWHRITLTGTANPVVIAARATPVEVGA
jgi:hypothetical protein